jgi:WD40 repeat protein
MMQWRRLTLVAGAILAATVAGGVLAVALTVATGGSARWFPSMDGFALWWAAGSGVAVTATGLLVWRAQAWYERISGELVPAASPLESWVVDRPAEVDQVVAALQHDAAGTVGITTAVHGAGGFGKTTIARMVRADPRILGRFRGRIYWVTLGRDAVGPTLAGLVTGLLTQLDPDRPVTFADARQAADHLAAVLADGPQRLLILDDVWTEEQLAVFPVAGQSVRLVTTRIPSLAAGYSVPVRVDQMTESQALALLQAGLPPLPPSIAAALVAETGRWALLLRLTSKILADQLKLDRDIATASKRLLARLRDGKLQVDKLTGMASRQLDVKDPVQRAKAVTATIQASTGMLSPIEGERLAELAVFGEDETIPLTLITALWQATANMHEIEARALCVRLADLALLTTTPGTGAVTMHDVIRDYLCGLLGDERLTQLHAVLVDAVAGGLPRAPAAAGGGTVTAWWELPAHARYLRDHLIEHFLAARRSHDAEAVAADLRWVATRLEHSGSAAPYADLTLTGTPRTNRLWRILGQAAHLLAPTDPPHSLTDVLYSRVSHDPDWGPQAQALSAIRKLPALSSKWPPPDLPSPALRSAIPGHRLVEALAIAPDGTWLVTGNNDTTARVWDTATGQHRATLTGHTRWVTDIAISADGTWLATAGHDGTARIWDAATWQCRATLTGHAGGLYAVAISPDGTWLATGSQDETVRIWDAATWQCCATLIGHTSWLTDVTISPDGTWLATADLDGMTRIWDAATGRHRATLADAAQAPVIAPDGTWLATTSKDKIVQIWDAATGQHRVTLTGGKSGVAISPDGTWLAAGGEDKTVQVWDVPSGQHRMTLTCDTSGMGTVAISPDGTWLAAGSADGTTQIWDAATGQHRAALTGQSGSIGGVSRMAISPDGTWLAAVTSDEGWRGFGTPLPHS